MENPAQVFGGTPQARGPIPPSSTLPDHWRMARAAHVDLLLMGMPRVNLLLIAPDGVVRFVLESLSARSARTDRALAPRRTADAATA